MYYRASSQLYKFSKWLVKFVSSNYVMETFWTKLSSWYLKIGTITAISGSEFYTFFDFSEIHYTDFHVDKLKKEWKQKIKFYVFIESYWKCGFGMEISGCLH